VERRLDLLLAPALEDQGFLNPRIQKAVELIRKEPDRNYSQRELAAALGLSTSRVLHLFTEQVGVPYRRFRMWKRLMLSFELLNSQEPRSIRASPTPPTTAMRSAIRSESIPRRSSARSSASTG
jgi:AraC-like DNA-binding protein